MEAYALMYTMFVLGQHYVISREGYCHESISVTGATSARGARARQQSRHKAISIFPWEPGPAKARGLKFKSFRCARDRFKFAKFRGAGIQLFNDGSVRKRRAKRSGERERETAARIASSRTVQIFTVR